MKRREGGDVQKSSATKSTGYYYYYFYHPQKKNYFVRIESASLSKTVMCFVAYFALVFSLSKHVK